MISGYNEPGSRTVVRNLIEHHLRPHHDHLRDDHGNLAGSEPLDQRELTEGALG